MEIKIYGLLDPFTNQIRYVGKTKNTLIQRLNKHIYESKTKTTYKCNWINKLIKLGAKPIAIELEICTEENWVEREMYWIAYYDNLTNVSKGGEGWNSTEETFNKISVKVKEYWLDPENRKKQSEQSKLYWLDPENRKKQSEKIKGSKHSEESSKLISDSKKELWKNEEYKNKMCSQSKELWENEEYRNKMLSYLQSKENKDKVSKRFKGIPIPDERKERIKQNMPHKKQISINGVIYNSISEAERILNIGRKTISVRLKSKKFIDYIYIEKEGD